MLTLTRLCYTSGLRMNRERRVALYVDPERDQFEAFKALPRDAAVMMLNLVKYRERARYDDGRDISGAEAYAAYGRESAPVFERVGGKIIWRGKPQVMLIGPFDQQWDLIFVARYPTAEAFLDMVTDPVYREAVKHRQAAVEDSRLIRTVEVPMGAGFAG
jgi:uncharacterized protein (DUF1330 family)